MKPDINLLIEDNSAILKTIDLYHDVIKSLSEKQTICKNQCIAITIPAFIVLVIKELQEYSFLLTIPVLILYLLDVHYLTLERFFRRGLSQLYDELNEGTFIRESLFRIKAYHYSNRYFFHAMLSFSTWPFYIGIVSIIVLGEITAYSITFSFF